MSGERETEDEREIYTKDMRERGGEEWKEKKREKVVLLNSYYYEVNKNYNETSKKHQYK